MNKVKKHYLIITILILLGFLMVDQLLSGNKERTLPDTILEIDTLNVGSVEIQVKNNTPFTLEKEEFKWLFKKDKIKDVANQNKVESILESIHLLKPLKLAANNKKKWSKYMVDDSLGTKVSVIDKDGDEMASFIVGKLDFNNRMRSGGSYIRLRDEDEVYAVKGMLSSSFNQESNYYRNDLFCEFKKDNINEIVFDYADSVKYVLKEQSGNWFKEGMKVDSSEIQNFISYASGLRSTKIDDNCERKDLYAYLTMEFKGDNMRPIVLNLFKHKTDKEKHILHSSMNEKHLIDDKRFFEKTLKHINKVI